jgi:flagellar biosynthetic protein FliR
MAVTMFILLGGHHAMFMVLVRSFETVPLAGYRPDGSMLQTIVGLLSAMFELGVRVAAPLLCLVFLQTVAMGFVARTVPQLNILSLGFPLRIMLGIAMTVALIAPMNNALASFIQETMTRLMQLFGG